ncbi:MULTISPECIES: radical SAM protein [unclassified Candidatus Frackibacter]|jgi:hypothetical protein|uniref:radical SAM protein n=1 Tax=unclassified Candidatus Frackibacter TaxID=2648818 RepID=UPI00079445A9|nr:MULTISPECIES: radical SAM protein [unclassified Candidatus Frackibacter]KXS40913.1 MAG: hypothetical protein AWU54_1809 [Candidatus Frackibacter sp. T328-2]SEM63070.1 hypothetical protein SAMN04488698_10971 [Candidatus Frackibacter sp. WG12]SFL64617.1 hypothetical protein SAMN04488699_10818 [Candidatus Frackibacter sp. WG13]
MEIRRITSALQKKVKEAWEVRKENFPPFIQFDYPTETKPVSLTGNQCHLDCAHCGGHYLEHMDSLDSLAKQEKNKYSSCLISGGCDSSGKIDFDAHLEELKHISNDKKLNMHVGLVDEEEIPKISQIADSVSFDFIADQETIKEVYGLNRTVDDYIKAYQNLRKEMTVLPHICIGLKGGVIAGEYRALEILKELGAEGLVFIVFIPTKDTRYENCSPPILEEVIEVLTTARINFPDIPIHLGCMRPKGRYRAELDYYAVAAGVNKVVVPTSFGIKKAEELGLEIKKGEECCIL